MRPINRLPLFVTLLACCCVPAPRACAATGQLVLRVVDRETGKPLTCRVHLHDQRGRPRKPTDRRIPFWHDHFVVDGEVTLRLPLGNYTFEMERGPEYVERSGYFTINHFADDTKEVDMRRFVDMSEHGWWSGDLDVRRPPRQIEQLMRAEDLHVAQIVTWTNDESQWGESGPPEKPLVRFDGDRFYHLMAGGQDRAGGTLHYFNLPRPLAWDGAGSEFPPPTVFIGRAREHEGAWVDLTRPFWWDLPMLAANSAVDSIQIAHSQLARDSYVGSEDGGKPRDEFRYPDPWGNAQWSQDIYFRLLDCGLRIPPTAGSGSGDAPNPVGYNRVYVHVDGELTYEKWWEALRRGRVTVTNGPLLRPTVRGELPGHVFHAPEGSELELEIGLTLSTRRPISYLEIVKNGKVEESIRFDEYAKSGRLPKVKFTESGWFLVRATTDVRETYRFAMTGPWYVQIGYEPRISRTSAQFFLDWVYERARQIKLADPAQRQAVIEPHRAARDFFKDLVERANAE